MWSEEIMYIFRGNKTKNKNGEKKANEIKIWVLI